MSDALTDIARDNQRDAAFGHYNAALMEFVKGRASLAHVVKMAEAVDSVPRGYWGSRTSFAELAKEFAEQLEAGNKQTWGRFLLQFTPWERDKYVKLSPFAEGTLFLLLDFSNCHDHDLAPAFEKAFRNAGLCTTQSNGGDKYALIIEPNVLARLVKKAVWLGFRVTTWYQNRPPYKHPLSSLRKERKAENE